MRNEELRSIRAEGGIFRVLFERLACRPILCNVLCNTQMLNRFKRQPICCFTSEDEEYVFSLHRDASISIAQVCLETCNIAGHVDTLEVKYKSEYNVSCIFTVNSLVNSVIYKSISPRIRYRLGSAYYRNGELFLFDYDLRVSFTNDKLV